MKIFKDRILLMGLMLLIFIVVPSIIISVYEYRTLSDEESVIENAYTNQLDALLFSLNQYNTDIVTNWVNEYERILRLPDKQKQSELETFFGKSKYFVFLNYQLLTHPDSSIALSGTTMADSFKTIINGYINQNPGEIDRLSSFLRKNYRQVVGIDTLLDGKPYTLFIFLLDPNKDKPGVGTLVIESDKYIREVLSPKIQEIAEDKVVIAVKQAWTGEIIYSNRDIPLKSLKKAKALWLMPRHLMAIQLVGNTIEDLSKRRVRIVIFALALFNLIIIVGMGYLYANIMRERELSKIKSDFVSNVSHEIRTPLAMISMYAETLLLGRVNGDEKKTEYYQIIFQETKRLTSIVNNILNFSRIENNRRSYNFQPASLNDTVANIIYAYKNILESEGFTYTFDKDESLPETMMDAEAITDALVNILSNAIKYSDKQKEIHLRTWNTGSAIHISISDKGIGIAEKDQNLIFDKFYRVTKGNLAHNAQGTGLGLSIVKHIMDAHKGKIDVTSEPEKGSTFTLTIPIASRNSEPNALL